MKGRGEMGKGKGGGGGEWESLGSTWVRHSAKLKASPKVRNHRNAKKKLDTSLLGSHRTLPLRCLVLLWQRPCD